VSSSPRGLEFILMVEEPPSTTDQERGAHIQSCCASGIQPARFQRRDKWVGGYERGSGARTLLQHAINPKQADFSEPPNHEVVINTTYEVYIIPINNIYMRW